VKKLFFSCLIVLLAGTGCKKEKGTDYASLVLGRWINIQVDHNPVLTDESFVIEFRSDGVETYAKGFQLDENNRSWIENDNYKYYLDGNCIIIDGYNDFGNKFHMVFEILSIDPSCMTYSVRKFMIDDQEYPDEKSYTNIKVSADLTSRFKGTWYGKSSTPGGTDPSFHYWDYLDNGHFNYYFQDSTGTWINKHDNEGGYFLYGSFLASNYTNDLNTGVSGKAFECWNIEIQGDSMFWTGLRENGATTSFRMAKVSGPPVSGSKSVKF